MTVLQLKRGTEGEEGLPSRLNSTAASGESRAPAHQRAGFHTLAFHRHLHPHEEPRLSHLLAKWSVWAYRSFSCSSSALLEPDTG